MSKKDSPLAVAKIKSESESDSDDKKAALFMNSAMRCQFLREMVKRLPEKVQNRIIALKNIQLEQLQLEAEFFEEVYNLEKKYNDIYKPLLDKRGEIIAGTFDPPKQTPQWKEPEEADPSENVEDIFKKMNLTKPNMDENVAGIPNFWLTVFRNTEILAEMVREHDEPLLKKLRDIKVKYEEGDEHSYTLEFYFDKNEYFSNPILTKKYFLKVTVDEEPFAFEGPEIYKCEGCDIKWEKGMNLTVKTIRKKQKHKERGAVRVITKIVPNDSFFNFFCTPDAQDDKDEEAQGILATDFEIGHFMRARVVPKAVLYYTGDIVDDDDDDCDEYDEEEEEDEDDDDDDGDGDGVKPMKPAKGKNAANPNDCPNQ